MTVADALTAIRHVGEVAAHDGKIRLRIPKLSEPALAPAIEVLRREKGAAILELECPPSNLKGRAVELWRAGDRFFVVADEGDRRALIERGIGAAGETWTPHELELVASLPDAAIRDEIERWKRATNGLVRDVERWRKHPSP